MQLPASDLAEPLHSTSPRTSYDEVPYSSYPYAQSHPNRLAVIATLFGMTPAPLDRCRVLELGCASGGNLIPMAAELPQASFLGIDLSTRQIAEGAKMIQALRLSNIELRSASIMDVDSSWGTFDYVICHGVYSWVPESVRQKIFEICATQLNPQGVAYISYNTYPGWHMRGTVREMMLFHVRKCSAPEERVGRARGLLNFLAQIVPENDAYSHLLRDELERLRNIADYYILHEHLETVNEPVLFYDFAQAAAAKGLQFIAEAQSGARYHEALGPAADQQVRQLASDLLEYEQYLDFMRNRMFRRSLLCRADVTLDRSFDTRRVRAFYVASPVVPEGTVDPATNDEAKFHIEGGIFATPAPIVKAAMSILAARWPEAVAFEDLVSETHARIAKTIPNLDFNTLAEALAGNLAHSFIRQVVEFYATPPRVRSSAGDFPQTSELARLQASLHPEVTSQLHNPVTLDPFARKVVLLSNGTRSREQLIADLRQAVRTGEIKAVDQTGQTPSDGVLDAALAEALDQTLQKLARLGLLC